MLMRVVDTEGVCTVEHDGWVVQLTFEYSGPHDASRGVIVTVRHDDGTVIRQFGDDVHVKLPELSWAVVV